MHSPRRPNNLSWQADKATSRQPAYDATADILIPWIETSCSQTLLLSAHICWTRYCEDSIATGVLQGLQDVMASRLRALWLCWSGSFRVRRKAEQCVTEAVHHRDVATIHEDKISSPTDFTWLYYQRYYYTPKAPKWQTKGALKASLAGADSIMDLSTRVCEVLVHTSHRPLLSQSGSGVEVRSRRKSFWAGRDGQGRR